MNAAKLLRYERGLSVKAVHEQTRVAMATIASLESGNQIAAKPALALATFYDVPIMQLLGLPAEDAVPTVDPLPTDEEAA